MSPLEWSFSPRNKTRFVNSLDGPKEEDRKLQIGVSFGKFAGVGTWLTLEREMGVEGSNAKWRMWWFVEEEEEEEQRD